MGLFSMFRLERVGRLGGRALAAPVRLRPLGFGATALARFALSSWHGLAEPKLAKRAKAGGPGRTRTCNQTVMSGGITIGFVDFAVFCLASSWNRVGDFGLVSRLCLLRSNPSVRSAPSFRPDLHARYADARSGGQGWPAFGPPLQRREASLTAASTTA